MIFEAARRAVSDIASPAFRSALFKTLGLTLLFLVATWFALLQAAEHFLGGVFSDWLVYLPDWTNPETWSSGAGLVGLIVLGFALAFVFALAIAPVSALVAGLFLDDAAEAIERRDYPAHEPGKALAIPTALWLAARFFVVTIVANLIALLLVLLPGINLLAFLLVNGYLLGREFFDFAAMRQRPIEEARALRSRHSGTIMFAGMLVACLLYVPVLNLVTPLFGAALMIHLHKRIAEHDPHVSNLPLGAGERLEFGREGRAA